MARRARVLRLQHQARAEDVQVASSPISCRNFASEPQCGQPATVGQGAVDRAVAKPHRVLWVKVFIDPNRVFILELVSRRGIEGIAVRRWIIRTGGRKDRKSTRLNSSHTVISYAVFCLKKKKKKNKIQDNQKNQIETSIDDAKQHNILCH